MKRKWGKGIPDFKEKDLMTEKELLTFAMEVVYKYEIEPNGYDIIAATDEVGKMPNFALKRDGAVSFIIVEAAIMPKMPALEQGAMTRILEHAKAYNAECYYAPIRFGACDPERCEACLALRCDSYNAYYCGLKLIETTSMLLPAAN